MSRACFSRRANTPHAIRNALLVQNIGLLTNPALTSTFQTSHTSMTQRPELLVNANSSVRFIVPPINNVNTSATQYNSEVLRMSPIASTLPTPSHFHHRSQRLLPGRYPSLQCGLQPAILALTIPQRPIIHARIQIPSFALPGPAQFMPKPAPPSQVPVIHKCSGDMALEIVRDLANRHSNDVANLRAVIESDIGITASLQSDWRTSINEVVRKAEEATRMAAAGETLGLAVKKIADDNKQGLLILDRNVTELNANIAGALSRADEAIRNGRHAENRIRQLEAYTQKSGAELSHITSSVNGLRSEVGESTQLAKQALLESQRFVQALSEIRNVASQGHSKAVEASHAAQMSQEEANRALREIMSLKNELGETRSLAQRSGAEAASAAHNSQEAKSLLSAIRAELEQHKHELRDVKASAHRSNQLVEEAVAEWRNSKSHLGETNQRLEHLVHRVDKTDSDLAAIFEDIAIWKRRTIEAAGEFRAPVRAR